MKIRYLLLLFALTLPALAQQNALTVQHDYSAAGSAAWLPIAGYTSHTLTWSQVGATTVTGCAVQVDGNSVNSGSGSAGGVVPSQSATTNGTITTTATSFSYARVTVTGCTAGTIRVTYSAVNAALSKGGGGSISGTSPIVVSGGVVSCPTCGTSLATVQSVAASGVNWPAWLTPSVTNPTTTPSLFVAATTGQTSHQVIGTCGTATAFAPCALVAGDIPTAIPIANIGSAGLSGTLPVSINSAGAISVANTNATYFPFQSLTTTGTSGASTVSGGVLNIPQYSGGPTLGTSAQVPVMNSGATAYAPQTITQDASVTAAGAWTNTGLKGVPFCTGFTPTNGQALQYTTGGSPNPCYGAVTITGGGNVSNTGTPVSQQVAEWTSATVVKGTTGFTDSGAQLTYTGQFQTDLLGAGNQAACQVTASGTYTNTQACADYMEGTLGLRSGIINARPEVISTDPFTVNFSPDWRLSTGPTNSTTCDDSGSNTNCTVAEVPIIIGASGLTIGLGPVLSGQNMSQGSLILSGPTNWKPPVGIPTEGSPTCSGTGGPAGATYYIGVQMVVNLETHSGKSPFAGPSAFVGKTVTCTTGQSTITVPAPTGGNAGSFTKTDYRIGIAANSTAAGIGDYYVQQPGVATTCGSAGTIDSTNDCLISGGSSTVAIASIQTASTSFPMAADNKTGDPVDLSNVMIVMGTRSTISFLEQFRDTAIACPSTGQGVNNPNVLIWNLNGEEGAGTNNGTVQIYGDCGGYTGIAGGFVYSESHTPNSTWSQVSMSGGPTSGAVPFFGLICDGRPDGSGSASGCPREMNNVTIALRGGGTADVDVEEQGDRAWLGISNFHGETQSSQDNIFVTNGAHLVFNHVEGFTGGNTIHLSSTAGFSSGLGLCPQGSATTYQERCSSGSVAIQDDTDASGSQPLLGYQAHWASNGTPSYFGNVTSNAAIKTTGNGVDAGYFALGGNTANFAVTANTVGFMGPTSATFTGYALQLPSTAPSGTQYLGCGTPSSGVSTCTFNTVSGAVSSVSNSDSTLTISPTTGAVVASLNLGHAQTWSALQTFGSNASIAATAHGVLLSQNTSAVTATAVGATNTVLHGNTGADPTYSAIVAGDITSGTITHTQTDATFPTLIASGTSAMGTGGITTGTCATVVTTTATGAATTDNLIANPTVDPTGVTGYAPSASGSLYIQAYITSGNVNFKVCNNSSGTITPSALTMQWRVIR